MSKELDAKKAKMAHKMMDMHSPKKHGFGTSEISRIKTVAERFNRSKKHVAVSHNGKEQLAF